jgi:cytochrome c peroxidase
MSVLSKLRCVEQIGGRLFRGAAVGALVVASAVLLSATTAAGQSGLRREKPLVPLPQSPLAPKNNPTTPEKAALGKQLFFDPRLSGDNTMSCASCHLPEKALADGLAKGKGHGGKALSRNTPSLLNAAFYSRYFWDGRAKSLEEQALGPIESPDEMNQDVGELEEELKAIPGYVKQFQAVFGSNVTRDGIARALAAFQRTLVSGPSPVDRYLAGDKNVLSDSARRGLELFTGEAGCVRCHKGPLLSDGEFYRLGVSSRDEGRAAVTGDPKDRGKFRTPSLRNVAQTAPYMHDGSQKSLFDVAMFYYRGVPTTTADGLPLDVQPLLGQSFSDMPDLVAFLEALSGEPPKITPPELPE